ncbi:MAG: hypothetical protein F6K22_01845 [Okeania sp. SIO2F4]|uniref:hypothetical protein n=1 Tax=Okeania sp. SIO2F4 TaxID=2607790 RepID=UPI00142BFF92|nr:hypothetical protein [Okeania sp. SIO2F4]NES01675.1 hypothetical protein [Okeania sp. SIO2F4]
MALLNETSDRQESFTGGANYNFTLGFAEKITKRMTCVVFKCFYSFPITYKLFVK